MYVNVDVTKPAKRSPGAGGNKKDIITLVDINDLVSEASRDDKGIVITGNHQFKPNAYAIQLYVTPSSISGKPKTEGEIDEEGIIQELVYSHPGSAKEIREHRANWLGRNCLIFVKHCDDGSVDQYGSLCAPMRMQFEATDDKDVNKTVFTFTSTNKGPDVAIYEGTLTLSSVAATVPADATTVDLSSGEGEYQLTDNSSDTVITTATNAVDGMVFTLLGSGGSHPATIGTTGDFVLKNGNSWTALAGATITFKAFKDGASSWMFYELSRT